MKKRGYSREFTPRSDRRIKREIDRVPPMLDERVQAKLARLQTAGENISLRSLTLRLWDNWARGLEDATITEESLLRALRSVRRLTAEALEAAAAAILEAERNNR
jgi:hypothetical protein